MCRIIIGLNLSHNGLVKLVRTPVTKRGLYTDLKLIYHKAFVVNRLPTCKWLYDSTQKIDSESRLEKSRLWPL